MLAQLNLDQIQTSALGNKLPVSVGDLISKVLPYVFGAAGIALLIYLILGGFQLMTSRGDPKAMQAAQAKITNALIGFVIIIIAYIIVQLVGQLLGISTFSTIFSGARTQQNAQITGN
jgi:uncharacterized membrane protein